MPATNDDLIGYWQITKMEVWGQAYVDLVVPGFIEFEMEDDHLMGQFQFGTVVGWLDCRLRDADGASYVEWSWEGRNDSDPGCGRGWVRLEASKLIGRLYIHCSDDSAFEAERQERPENGRRRSQPRTEAPRSH
jgi:hypothetical protein